MDQLSQLIIPTKLNQPPVRHDLVLRQHLHELLTTGLSRRLTLVSAPAGYGKTTLVSTWLKQLNFPVAWLSLDQQDNNLARFLAYLVAALHPSHPACESFLIERPHPSKQPPIEALPGYILQELASLTPLTVLVLDDYHLISNPDIHEAVNFILQNLPTPDPHSSEGGRGCHVVIITRSDPPFPLSRWRLHRELSEVRTDDLRFSLDEAVLIFNHILQLNLTLEDVAALKSHTEGWVAGLQLAAMSLKGQKANSYNQFIHQFQGNNSLIADYLVEEVLIQQPSELQSFLLQTSILERMQSELCDAVTLKQGSQTILETLERNNVFVMPLDGTRNWYRYHQLFADVLAKRLRLLRYDQYQEAHIRAAGWLETHGYIEDSLKHWLMAEKIDQAARLVTNTAPSLLSLGKFYILRSMLESFPDESFQQWPWLSIYRAWAYYILEPEAIEFWLNLAERVIQRSKVKELTDEAEINEMLGNIVALRAISAAYQGDLDTTLALAPRAQALLAEEDTKVRGLVFFAIGTGCLLKGELDKALQNFIEAKTTLRQGGNFGGTADALGLVGDIHTIQGKLHAAASAYREAISLEKHHTGSEACYACKSYSGLGKVQFEWNQMDGAVANLSRGYELSERMGLSERVTGGISLAAALLGLGNLDRAEKILGEHIILIGNHTLLPWVESQLVAGWLHFLAANRDFRELDRLAIERGLTPDSASHPVGDGVTGLIREPEGMAYAYACLIRGDLKSCVNLASQLEQSMASGGRMGRQIHVLALQAVGLKLLGEQVAAQTVVIRALNLGFREGFLRTFVDLGEPMLELMTGLTTSQSIEAFNLDRAYLGEVISAFLAPVKSSASYHPVRVETVHRHKDMPAVFMEPLTERELKVLKLIIGEQSNSEIARELAVSINTVKTHTANIFSKLGVHNRLQAANRARQLGLL